MSERREDGGQALSSRGPWGVRPLIPMDHRTLGGPLPRSEPQFALSTMGSQPLAHEWLVEGRAQALRGGPRVLRVERPCLQALDCLALLTGISSPVKKTEMDKSPFNSPSPQDSPRLSSFTQHHRPVIAVHSGEHCGPQVWRAGWALLTGPLQPGKSHQLSDHKSYCCTLPSRQESLQVLWQRAPRPDSLETSFSPFVPRGAAGGSPLHLLPICHTQVTHGQILGLDRHIGHTRCVTHGLPWWSSG